MASAALVLLAPLLLLLAAAVFLTSKGPVLVRAPQVLPNGRLAHLTEFRIFRSFDAETHDRLAGQPERWITPVGRLLRATRFNRLPVLLDVRAGQVTLQEAMLG